MPDFEFEFNQQDKDLILNQIDGFFTDNHYIRLTIYPSEGLGNVVTLPDNTKGIDGKAIFFSSLSSSTYLIDVSPFKQNNTIKYEPYGGSNNDFKIYQNGEDVYIKPNEIFNAFELPQGNYRIQIDFLQQVKPLAGTTINPDDNPNPIADTGDEGDTGGDVELTQTFYPFIIKQISINLF